MSEPSSGLTPGGYGYRAPPPRQRPAWRTLVWIVVAVLVALAIAWVITPHGAAPGKRGAGGASSGRRPPTVVGVATATRGDIPIQLTALGTVTSRASVTVRTRIAGTLMKVYFREGQIVREGDTLVEVDPRPYAIALAQAQAQLAHDQALLASAQLDLKRYETLKAQDSISGQQVDTQEALVKQDVGTVKSDEATVANAKLNLVYCRVTAPVSGRVGLRQVDAGNYVSTSDTNGLVNMTQIDPIDVVFTLPEDNVAQVNQRVATGATLTVTAFDRTGGSSLAEGTLSTLDNEIDTTTGTVKAKAAFRNASGVLFPNQFVNVTLLVDTLRDTVIVPSTSVRHGSKGDYIYTVQSDPLFGDTAKVVYVKVGPVVGERTAILSGLNVGERVITDGGDRLSDGATVLLPGQKAGGGGPQKKPGFFDWIAGLFGKKPAATGAGAGGASASADSGSAGGGGGGGGGGQGGGGGRMRAMLAQVGLTPDQQKQADAILADARAKAQAANGDQDARRTAMREAMTKITALLTPEQKAKLDQLRAQGGGAGGGAPQAAGAGPSVPPAGTTQAAEAQVRAANPPSSGAPSLGLSTPAQPTGGGGSVGGGSGGGGGGGGSGRMQAMFTALDLDAGQQAKATAFFAAARAKAEAANGDPDARRTAMREAFGKLEGILRPDQKEKFAAMRARMGGGQGGGGGG